MQHLGWSTIFENIDNGELEGMKTAIFEDLQPYKQADGLHFKKRVFFISGVK